MHVGKRGFAGVTDAVMFQGAGKGDLDIYSMILHSPKCSAAVEGTLECQTSAVRPSSQTLPTE